MKVLSGGEGCEMEAMTDVIEFASRNGRKRVLVDGFQKFGAIMKNPWLHTAFSKLKVVMHSPNANFNKQPFIFCSLSLYLSCPVSSPFTMHVIANSFLYFLK